MKIQSVPEGAQNIPEVLRELIEESQELLQESREAKNQGNSELAAAKAETAIGVINNVAQIIARENPDLATLFVALKDGHRSITTTETQEIKGESRHTKGFLFFQFAETRTNNDTKTLSRKIEIR
jgi:uncharacterized membrane protein